MKDNVDYGELAEELFSELQKKTTLPPQGGDLGSSGNPQSMLESACISNLSSYSCSK